MYPIQLWQVSKITWTFQSWSIPNRSHRRFCCYCCWSQHLWKFDGTLKGKQEKNINWKIREINFIFEENLLVSRKIIGFFLWNEFFLFNLGIVVNILGICRCWQQRNKNNTCKIDFIKKSTVGLLNEYKFT